MFDTLFFFIFIIAVIASVVKRAMDAARKVTGSKAWAEMTSVERKVQRELEEYVRKRKPAPVPSAGGGVRPSAEGGVRSAEKSDAYSVPAPLAPAPAVVAPAVVAAAPAVVALAPPVMPPPVVSAPSALRAPRLAAPRRRMPVRLNARVMSRVAILSEIWRPPVALREGNPWDRR